MPHPASAGLINKMLAGIVGLAKSVERVADSLTDFRYLGGRRDDWKIGIRTYATYGTKDQVCFRGRVLRDHAATEPTLDDRWYKNAIRAFHVFESDEVPGASVEVTFCDHRCVIQSDDEGYLEAFFDVEPTDLASGWHSISGKILAVPFGKTDQQVFESHCLIPNDDANFGIISDIDDTVLDSAVTRPLKMLSLVIFGNWLRRAAVQGTPDLYQRLVDGSSGDDRNPVFYVSSSPWNLEPMIKAFLKRVGLPIGPMMLRDLGVGRDMDLGLTHGHKEVKIQRLLDTYPAMRFVLLGDAGQEDAAIYARICEQYGDRIIVAYIRQVGTMPSNRIVKAVAHASDKGAPIFLLPGSDAITADAVKRSIIASPDRAVATLKNEPVRRQDDQPTGHDETKSFQSDPMWPHQRDQGSRHVEPVR